jgi:nucleoside-diphosphate-sugar epimerase
MEKGRAGESYFLAGPVHTVIDALKVAEEITGVAVPKMTAPPTVMKAMSALMSVIERVVPVPDNYSSEYLRVNAGTTYLGGNEKARRELGWTVRDLREGLAETLESEMRARRALTK